MFVFLKITMFINFVFIFSTRFKTFIMSNVVHEEMRIIIKMKIENIKTKFIKVIIFNKINFFYSGFKY